MRPAPLLLPLALSLAVSTAFADEAPVQPRQQPSLQALSTQPSEAELHATIEKLISFGTRHTLSDTKSDKRGIGAARRWVKSRFEEISKECGGCIEVATPSQVFTGKRIPQPTEVMDVVAIKRGKGDPQRVIVMTGHLDSRVTDVMNAKSDAPGANDDASGVAALMEAARILSKQDNDATLVFAALSGEEQGLYGGKVLADYAVAQGWKVQADLNNDIVGNSHGQNGVLDNLTVRVFSEGTKRNETPEQAKFRAYHGGEVDSPSRNVARYMEQIASTYLPDIRVHMVYRADRYSR
ncbi:MAG: M20/M25/M40 family metallo-hydrolase, partial [Dyella sp.]|nr:M20/M25/M40 family metallo-hydrolase [Dyella sp.]